MSVLITEARFLNPTEAATSDPRWGVLVVDLGGEIKTWTTLIPPQDGFLKDLYDEWVAADPENVPLEPENYQAPVEQQFISNEQLFQGLAEEGIITWDEATAALFGTIPATLLEPYKLNFSDGTAKSRAAFRLARQKTFGLDDLFIDVVATLQSWDSTARSQFWASCLAL